MKKNLITLLFISLMMPGLVSAQEIFNSQNETIRAKVLEVLSSEIREIPGTGTDHLYQDIRAQIIDGDREGEIIQFENEFFELERGDKFYAIHNVYIDGRESYGVTNIDRRGGLLLLVLVFAVVVIIFGKWQGVRSLISLLGSFLIIFFVLIPGLLAGWNPILASSVVAAGILFMAIFFTHGFNRESIVAFGGTMVAVIITSFFALIAVEGTHLNGFASDESVYLNFNTGGELDFLGILLGAIILGFLGVLDDIAVTQAAIVTELYNSNHKITSSEVFKKAMRVGREHVSALVNTLVLAYTGASLPVLLLFFNTAASADVIINLEVVATEIVRMIVGSMGLVLTVPIVTFLAVKYLKGYTPKHQHQHSHVH